MTRWAALPGPLRGAFWALLQVLVFSVLAVSVRKLSATMSAFEIMFFRALIGFLFVVPWAVRVGPAGWRPRRFALVTVRSVLLFGAVLAWFVAIAMIPVSDAVAVQFTIPLFVVLAAGPVLGERIGPRRALVVVAGFAGALVVIRPGFVEVSPAVLLVLLSVVLYVAVHLITKVMAGEVSGSLLVFHMNFMMAPLGLAFAVALGGWTTPSWADMPWLVVVGVTGALAHIFMTRAYRAADASFVEPIDFLRLPLTALFGWVLFGETSDLWTWAGAVIIFGAVTYNTGTEAGRAYRRRLTGQRE